MLQSAVDGIVEIPAEQFYRVDTDQGLAQGSAPAVGELQGGGHDAVVQVIDEEDSEVVYTLRIPGRVFRPFVFRPGRYALRVSDPGTGKTEVLRGLEAVSGNEARMTVRW